MKVEKILLFGGSFDPIHVGHTRVCEDASVKTGADKVIFVPAKRSPLKVHNPKASDEDRLRMIELAIEGKELFSVSDLELNGGDPSYTVNTVKYFREKFGDDVKIGFLMGADNIDQLYRWYKVDEILELCDIYIMYRAGCERPDVSVLEGKFESEVLERLRENIIETSLVEVSSSEVRRRIGEGEDVRGMVDGKVLDYIKRNKLYGWGQ